MYIFLIFSSFKKTLKMQKITQIHQKYIFLDFLKQVRKKSLKF
jgi:hypothetical protein